MQNDSCSLCRYRRWTCKPQQVRSLYTGWGWVFQILVSPTPVGKSCTPPRLSIANSFLKYICYYNLWQFSENNPVRYLAAECKELCASRSPQDYYACGRLLLGCGCFHFVVNKMQTNNTLMVSPRCPCEVGKNSLEVNMLGD